MTNTQANHNPAWRWAVCAMLFFATSINYMDRQVLGILSPTLQRTIGWSETQYGYIIAAFQVAYAAGLLVCGRLIDRFGTRAGYAVVMGFWSLAAAGHALARSAFSFGVARFFLGLGESGNFPAALKTTAEWFPRKERSTAVGIFNSGANVGAILAPIFVPIVTMRLGWPFAFLCTSAFSTLWLLVWVLRYRTPVSSEQCQGHDDENACTVSERVPVSLRRLLLCRQLWAFPLAKFLTDPVWWFYLYWLPKFFDARYHVSLLHLGLPLIIVYNASTVGSVAGGWLPSAFHRRGISISNARLLALLLCACATLPVLFANRLPSMWFAVGLLSVAAAAHQGWSANLLTLPSDLFPKSAVATVVGIGGTAGSIGGVLFAIGTGWILQMTHSYGVLFAVAGGAYLLALVCVALIAPGLRAPDPNRLIQEHTHASASACVQC